MLSKKYRPSKFSELVGQEKNVLLLKEILRDAEDTPPLIFTGPWGAGKTSTSRVFAKAVLCEKLTEDMEPCCECQSCLDFDEDKNPNYLEIDAATNGDVESIRNLRSQIEYQTVGNSKFKITNIDEAHNITKQGYNALLKILEKGSTHHIFLFCTNEPKKVIDTVQSRIWNIEVTTITQDVLVAHLKKVAEKEGIEVEPGAIELIAKLTIPHLRDALNALEFINLGKKVTVAGVESYFQLTEKNKYLKLILCLQNDIPQCFTILNELLEKNDLENIFEKIVDVCLALEAVKKGVNHDGYYDENLFSELLNLNLDYLGIASYLLKIEKPVDLVYLKFMLLELNRILNKDSTSNYGDPNITPTTNTKVEAPAIIQNETKSLKQKIAVFDVLPDQIMSLSDESPNKTSDSKLVSEVNVVTSGTAQAKETNPTPFRSFIRPRKPIPMMSEINNGEFQKKEKS